MTIAEAIRHATQQGDPSMDQHNATPDTQERSSVGRRTVLKGAAWSVPVVAVVGATPAFAATNTVFTFETLTPALINAQTTASLTATGNGPDGQTINFTINGDPAGTTTVSNGVWSKTFADALVPEGAGVEVKATYGSTTFTKTYTKDITAPVLTGTATDTASNKKSGTLSGAYGMLNTPTADGVVSVSFTSPGSFSHTLTQTAGTWNLSWTWTKKTGNGLRQVITIEQSDGAGNKTTLTYKIV